MKIGVLSDTHNLLRREVLKLFQGVDCIIHAGDVGTNNILVELESLAPVHAVYGNCDRFPLTEQLKDREILQLEDVNAFVTHIGGKPKEMREYYPDLAGCRLVIFGHSHRASRTEDAGVLFFNPGSAGPRRFQLRPTVGMVEIHGSQIDAKIVEIS